METRIDKEHLKHIIEHFKGKLVDDKVLAEFCHLHHYNVVNTDTYHDFLYQYEFDNKVAELIPALLPLLAKYTYIPTAISHAERQTLIAANDEIEVEACKLLEELGFTEKELTSLGGDLRNFFMMFVVNTLSRAENMVKTMLHYNAALKYGEPISLKAMAEDHRKVAKELGVKEGKV